MKVKHSFDKNNFLFVGAFVKIPRFLKLFRVKGVLRHFALCFYCLFTLFGMNNVVELDFLVERNEK